jgi:hypothetical protein
LLTGVAFDPQFSRHDTDGIVAAIRKVYTGLLKE